MTAEANKTISPGNFHNFIQFFYFLFDFRGFCHDVCDSNRIKMVSQKFHIYKNKI